MVRPLYNSANPAFDSSQSHAGLWYDKFCDRWTGPWLSPEVQKPDWIRTVTNGLVGNNAALKEFAWRQRSLVRAIGGNSLTFKTEGRFVTGLGREHPVENGFAWHPTLGSSYLPGSSIKGLIRAWATDWESEQSPMLDEILGPCQLREFDSGQAGAVIFFDAIPLQPIQLELEVMTPHYGEYYQSGEIPGDWLSPTPIPFLVVAAGQPFQFSIAPRTAAGRDRLTIVESWLKNALEWLGAGGKTAVGYGRFQHDEAEDEALAHEDEAERQRCADLAIREARLSNASPAFRRLIEEAESGQWLAGNTQLLDGIDLYLSGVPSPTAECIEWIRMNGLETFWPGIWEQPDAKRGKRGDKFKFTSSRARELVHRLKQIGSSN